MAPERRGVPRRPRRDVAGAAGADGGAAAATSARRWRRARSSTCVASSVGHSPAATAARCSTCSRRPRARCCTRTRPATGRGILDGLRPDVAILAAAGRGNIDGEPIQGSLADFVGRQVGRRAAPRGCCSATTTTGCPASRCRPTWRRCAPPSPRRRPARSCSNPATSPAPTCSPAWPPGPPDATIRAPMADTHPRRIAWRPTARSPWSMSHDSNDVSVAIDAASVVGAGGGSPARLGSGAPPAPRAAGAAAGGARRAGADRRP